MIFKAYQPQTGKWFLWDNIRLVKTHYGEMPDQPYDPENFVNLLPDTPLVSGECVANIDLIFQNGPSKEVVFKSGDGFLMNDDGKTIERL